MKSGITPASKAGLNGGIALSHVSAPSLAGNGKSFGEVVSFVNRHSKLHVLSNVRSGASIAVWPAMQGRVLTSTAGGPEGLSFGWVNHELIASGEIRQHVNAVGGEDRIWLGPEGGQYSIFLRREFHSIWSTGTRPRRSTSILSISLGQAAPR
ncbi:MAG: DUF6786 family protein [Terracidiphilus sp.]|jgi:hypothetical protein